MDRAKTKPIGAMRRGLLQPRRDRRPNGGVAAG